MIAGLVVNRVTRLRSLDSISTEEYKTNLAGHVKGGQQGCENGEPECPAGNAPSVGCMKYLVLAPETGEKDRHTGQGHHSHGIGCESHGHQLFQAAHPADVLFLMTTVDHRAGAQKE